MPYFIVQVTSSQKQVWKLAFFSRLDERKGLRIFVDAISALNVTKLPDGFEVWDLEMHVFTTAAWQLICGNHLHVTSCISRLA